MKYGAINHVHIGWKYSLSRALRHILSSLTYQTDINNSKAEEISHAILRLFMAYDSIIWNELDFNDTIKPDLPDNSPDKTFNDTHSLSEVRLSVSDFLDTIRIYRTNDFLPNLQLFPSALRRVSMLLTSNELSNLLYGIDHINTSAELIIDILIEEIMKDLSSTFDSVMNNILLYAAILIHILPMLENLEGNKYCAELDGDDLHNKGNSDTIAVVRGGFFG